MVSGNVRGFLFDSCYAGCWTPAAPWVGWTSRKDDPCGPIVHRAIERTIRSAPRRAASRKGDSEAGGSVLQYPARRGTQLGKSGFARQNVIYPSDVGPSPTCQAAPCRGSGRPRKSSEASGDGHVQHAFEPPAESPAVRVLFTTRRCEAVREQTGSECQTVPQRTRTSCGKKRQFASRCDTERRSHRPDSNGRPAVYKTASMGM